VFATGNTRDHLYSPFLRAVLAIIANICNLAMEYQYDSDISEDTRDLISQGLATDTRKYNMRPELGSSERDSALNRNMNASYVRLPLSHIVPVEEPSARGLNMACGESVKGQKYNSSVPVSDDHKVLGRAVCDHQTQSALLLSD